MSRRFPLQSLRDLAQTHLDDAAKILHSLKVRWQEAEGKLQELISYREDYRLRLLHATKQGLSATLWRDFQSFLDKLDVAIRQQREEVGRCERRWEVGQREWLARRHKLKAYDTLAERHMQKEDQRIARLEQRDMDEFAGKSFESKRIKDTES